MELLHRIAADVVVLVHFAFIVFVVLGGLLVLKWQQVVWLHLPAAAWGAGIEFMGWVCPLTPLENSLRMAGRGAAYSNSFIEHYIVPIIYPSGLTRDTQIILGVIVVVLNTVIYMLVWRRRKRVS